MTQKLIEWLQGKLFTCYRFNLSFSMVWAMPPGEVHRMGKQKKKLSCLVFCFQMRTRMPSSCVNSTTWLPQTFMLSAEMVSCWGLTLGFLCSWCWRLLWAKQSGILRCKKPALTLIYIHLCTYSPLKSYLKGNYSVICTEYPQDLNNFFRYLQKTFDWNFLVWC